jgi:hypothetical protein
MAEVIGVVSGLLGTCDIIIRSSKFIVSCVSDIKNAPEDIKKIHVEVENLEAITAAARGYLGSSKAHTQDIDKSAAIATLLNQCKAFIVQLQDAIAGERMSTAAKRAKWALLKKDQVGKILGDLARLQTCCNSR